MAMTTVNSTKDFWFIIREMTEPWQELTVEDHRAKGLRIQFSSTARSFVLVQSADGVVRGVHASADRNDAFTCPSYEEMLEKQPQFATDFHAVLEGLGINRPLSLRDPRVLQVIGLSLIHI